MNNDLYDPIIWRGQGECSNCGGSMIAVDQEVSVMQLDKDGQPLTEDTSIKVNIVCTRCGSKFPAVRNGMGYCLYTEASHLIRMENIRAQRIKDLEAQKHNPKENPFGFIDRPQDIFDRTFKLFDNMEKNV